MNSSQLINRARLLLGAGVALCALLNSTTFALPGILDTAVNPGNNHIYYLLTNSTWTDAESAAVGFGGHLTTINDLAENNWMWNLWGTNRNLWIGLSDPINGDGTGAAHAANFGWADGDASTYRNWRPGEPNNGNTGEYNAYILAKGLVIEGGAWNDGPNLDTIAGQYPVYGVVELVPEPSSALLLVGGMLAAFCAKRMRSRR